MSDGRPLVTVVITTFADGRFLDEAVVSVRAQSYRPIQLVISDDGSTDPVTCAALDRYTDEGETVLRNAHAGVSANRNAALAVAEGEFLVFLDADDAILPDYVEVAVALIEADPAVGIVAPDWHYVGTTEAVEPMRFSLGAMLAGNLLPISCLCRTADVRASGGFRTELSTHEDWDLWLSLLARGRTVALTGRPHFRRRVRAGQVSDTMTPATNAPAHARVFVRHQQLYADHAEEFWRVILAQQSLLLVLKARYGPLNAALRRLAWVRSVRALAPAWGARRRG